MENSRKNFIIMIGRSGCGKGTQSKLLSDYIESNFSIKVIHITTGGNFRNFLNSETFSAKRSKDIVNNGNLMPEFLAIWNWANIFINNLKGDESVILDGAPRKMIEVKALETAIDFYDYDAPTVIYLDVSESWARERLSERGREDDALTEDVNRKMEWFERDVMPCIDWYKNVDTRVNFIHVNGERDVDEVHKDIISKLV